MVGSARYRNPALTLLVSVLLWGGAARALWCDRTPVGITGDKTDGDNGYKILISGDADRYIPGAVYTVRLQGPGDQYVVDKFSGFLLVVEPGSSDGHSPENSAGSFQLTADSLARFSEYCPHAVKHASELPKTEVQVRWTAPPVAAGCVVFRATVVRNKGQWFMDDGALTKQLCPENNFGAEESDSADPCCACDEAKYELTFEGLWSSLTHPKDFPENTLSAHFSDLIGASHSPNFRFWEYDGHATDGLKVFAEQGETRELESELKAKSTNIRTIIKARGLKNPTFYGYKTFAVFRADRDHNLISLVSKIDPSPDWFVGVSGLNLCFSNCSWAESKVINLFPWDAGTNNGVLYTPPGDATEPREKIKRIVWTSNENSPFYDPSGNMIKPFARLRLTKQRSYDRGCPEQMPQGVSPNEDGAAEHENKPQCKVSKWTEWTPCSASCGQGVQTKERYYTNPRRANEFGCNRKLVERKNCQNTAGCRGGASSGGSYSTYGGSSGSGHSAGGHWANPRPSFGDTYGHHDPGSSGRRPSSNPCATTNWFEWSRCSATCGKGVRTRERRFQNPTLAEENRCHNAHLRESEYCSAPVDCSVAAGTVEPGCETTEWSDWGACDVPCGKGKRSRTRYFTDHLASHQNCGAVELVEYQTCDGLRPTCSSQQDMQEICKLPKAIGSCPGNGEVTRWYYDVRQKQCLKFQYQMCAGNKNNFNSEKQCEKECGFMKNLDADFDYDDDGMAVDTPYSSWPSSPMRSPADGPVIDCVVSEWSNWSKCSSGCGHGYRTRTRYIRVFNVNGGQSCPSLRETKKCKDFSACEEERSGRD